jgi:hypothetical protein
VFDEKVVLPEGEQPFAAITGALDKAHGVQPVRVIVMTQACDLEQREVRNAILCPIYHLKEYQNEWDKDQKAKGQNPTPKAWSAEAERIKKGFVWNLTMLDGRTTDPPGITIAPQVVDFHEVFSLPAEFLQALIKCRNASRIRLCPPYREHLAQAFARFFMRVGLPVNIAL